MTTNVNVILVARHGIAWGEFTGGSAPPPPLGSIVNEFWIKNAGSTHGIPFGAFTTGGVTPVAPEHFSGGYEIGRVGQRRTPEQLRRARDEFGLPNKAAEIIAAVAARQAEALRQDEQQRFDELVGELKLQGIEWESRYLTALNTLREREIDAEIGRRLRIIQDNEDILTLLMLVASMS